MNSFKTSSKRILSFLLIFAIAFSASLMSSSADGFAYIHDPRENASAKRDIVADENAVYGFRPNDTGSLKIYADADWSDPELVAQGRADRIAYHESVETMYTMLREMRDQGSSVEEIARAVSTRRNEIRLEAYADDPEALAELKARNLEKYGHEEGPLPDELFEKYGSWERVIEKSFSTNAGMDACLGLYDDYYYLYVAIGDVPADVTITIPKTLSCGLRKTVALSPKIETNAVNYKLTFSSDDPRIASIDENGVVKGLRFGKTTVRCVLTDAGGNEYVSEPCSVRVRSNILLWLESFFACVREFIKA